MARDDVLTTAGGFLLALALLPALWPGDASAGAICPDTDNVQLTVGQTKDAGDVKVCNDDTTLTITYEATSPFCLLETDLHVATSLGDIPQNKQGSPKPDEFAYGDEYDPPPCVGKAPFEVLLAEIGEDGVSPGDSVVVAARADLEDEDGRVEEAWGEGTHFVERRTWAMYFTYEVQEPFLCGGEDSKCVFVTSSTHNGNLGGLAGGDAICQAGAEADGSLAAPGTYKAWLTDGGNSPSTRFTRASVPYKLVNGTRIADHWDDLTDGTLNAPISVTELGDAPPVSRVWTGTDAFGFLFGAHCTDWTSSNELFFELGSAGESNQSDLLWSYSGLLACSDSEALYCFQQ